MTWWRLTLAILVCAGLFAGYSLLLNGRGADNSHLMTAIVTRGAVEESVLATGILKPARLVAVGAQASGRITAIKVKLGDKVNAGALIAEIDSVTQRNAVRTAEAELANVRAQLVEKQATRVLNQRSLRRQEAMVKSNAVAQADYDTAIADLGVTEAQIVALQAQINEAEVAVEAANTNLGYTRITAPNDGTVLSIVSQEGQTVNATQSAPTIVVMGQLDTMTVRTEISEADVVKVSPGLPVYFTIFGEPGRRHDARLISIEPAPESIKNDSSFSSSSSSTTSSSTSTSSEAIYYNGVFDVPNQDGRLRTYMTAEVHIILGSATDVLTIPSAALSASARGGRHTVRVLAPDGQVAVRDVTIGLNNKVTAEIRSGLTEGERVVTGETTAETSSRNMGGPGGPPMGF